jgi:polysaccharide biosynthesis transport protein
MNETTTIHEEASGGSLLNHLPTVFWQRRWLIILPFLLLSAAGCVAAYLLPAVYVSSATLLVESQDLPSDVVQMPDTSLIDQRIAKIRAQALSRGDLIELIQQHDLYPEDRRSKPLSTVIEKMRASTAIEAVSANLGQDSKNTIAFAVSFSYFEPQPAQLIVQEYVRRFLDLASTESSEQVRSTVDFLAAQANELQRQVVEVEQQITAIKRQNGAMLTGAGYPVLVNSGSYDAQIAALRRDNAILGRQAQASVKDPGVAAAEAQLAAARATYSDNHPDVRIMEQRLQQARRIAATSGAGRDGDAVASQIEANNAQIAALERARDTDLSQAAAARGAQAQGPVLMERIAQMESRADTLRLQHRQVAEKLLTARTAARAEEEQRGERLALIEAPVVPDRPISPNRPLLVLGGIGAGLLAGLILALAVELVLRPIRGPKEVERLTGAPPLGVIPMFDDKRARAGGKRSLGRRVIAWRRAA